MWGREGHRDRRCPRLDPSFLCQEDWGLSRDTVSRVDTHRLYRTDLPHSAHPAGPRRPRTPDTRPRSWRSGEECRCCVNPKGFVFLESELVSLGCWSLLLLVLVVVRPIDQRYPYPCPGEGRVPRTLSPRETTLGPLHLSDPCQGGSFGKVPPTTTVVRWRGCFRWRGGTVDVTSGPVLAGDGVL